MSRLTPVLLAVLAIAGCAKNTSRPTAKMRAPTGVAIYRGYASDTPGTLRNLVAVSNTGGNDLRVIDAVTDIVLLSPTLASALVVPTEPRPMLIAAGRLDDVDPITLGVVPRPDLLVVAPQGLVGRPGLPGQFAAAIQVVVTWEPSTRVGATIDLGDVAPGATITALLVTPEVLPDGTRRPGTARLLVGLSDGGLLTFEATRDAGSDAIVLGDPTRADLGVILQALGFVPLDLASSTDGTRLYVATTEPIPGPGGVLGVAELDVTGDPAAGFPVRALSARAGTTHVAAVMLAPFTSNKTYAEATVPDFDNFGPPAPRVLATIDSSACGRDRSLPCGIAVIDPLTGTLASDPAGQMPYQLPFQVNGEVVAMAASGPPEVSSQPGFLQLAPGSGKRWTQSIAAISSSAGRVFIADLSHFTLANDVSALAGGSNTRVTTSKSVIPSPDSNIIGIWQRVPPTKQGDPWPVLTDLQAIPGLGVTPGYTPTDDWILGYQSALPGLGNRLALATVPVGGAPTRLAFQEATGLTGAGVNPWRSVVRVYDPRLGLQVADIVEVTAVQPPGAPLPVLCPLGTFEMAVTAILPPTVDAPGGALALAPLAAQPVNYGQTLPADPNCLGAATAPVQVTATVRTWGYSLIGNATGYAGRPVEVQDPTNDFEPAFELKYENEDLLSCPIMPDSPEAWPPPQAALDACEADVATCRATCERLVLSRRARRIFYVTNRCSQQGETTCYNLWVNPATTPYRLVFPMPQGPVVFFKLGVKRPTGGNDPPQRGAFLSFSTGSGYSPTSRVPYTGSAVSAAVLPGRVLLFDKTAITKLEGDGIHGFAAYVDNLVLEFASGAAAQNATTIR